MDYEKKYKEVLSQAEQVYKTPHTAHWDVMKGLIEHLFPELKESEDERIIKALKEGFKYHQLSNNPTFGGIPCTEIVNWLEKQREQKPAEWSLPYGKNETAEKLIALAECLEMDGDCLFNGLSGDDYGKFLRVLAKELTEIKSAEWSEEDEDAIGIAIIALEDMYDPDEPNTTYAGYSMPFNKAAERLKSLRPQNIWKPSEEQMKQLGWIAKQNKDNMIGKELMTLYNDLKKLSWE